MESGWQIIRLQARIAALEAALRRRSEELRRIEQQVSPAGLAIIERVMKEVPIGAATTSDANEWRETFSMIPADVETLLAELWRGDLKSPFRGSR
ncbi:MAG: hypothetical protein ABI609_13795 [Acidobacteriota bacterium]